MKKIGKFVLMILIIMIGIYGVKMIASKYNIPLVSKVAGGV